MKRLFLSSIIMLIAIAVSAQVKVAPKLAKGQKMSYTTVSTANVGMTIKATTDVTYEVTDETADGFVITATTTKFETEGGEEMVRTMMTLTEQALLNQPLELTTTREGKVTGIRNLAAAQKSISDLAMKLVEELYAKNPAFAQAMPKEAMVEQVNSAADEQALLKSIALTPTSPLVLNGLTVQNMGQDTYVNSQNINMKRMYFVTNAGKTITTSSTANMTEAEVKDYIIQQAEKQAPDQAEMIKQNIDAMMASGMMKINASEKTKYDLGENGWVSAIEASSTMSVMGQNITMEAKVTLK